MMKRNRLKRYRGIDPDYSFCVMVNGKEAIWFHKQRQISQEEFDKMTKNRLKGRDATFLPSWSGNGQQE